MFTPEIKALREEIINHFGNAYLLNDPAHREEHFDDVFKTAVYIRDALGLNINTELILKAAYFHDMFAWSRHNHHILSAEWVRTTDSKFVVNLDEAYKWGLETACREHRASYKGKFSNSFSELINSADRGMPGKIEDMLNRAIQYRQAQNMDPTLIESDAIAHLKEKWGKAGYARFPRMYLEVFSYQLEQQRHDIENL